LQYTKRKILGTRNVPFRIQPYFLFRYLQNISPDEVWTQQEVGVVGYPVYTREKKVREMKAVDFLGVKDAGGVAITASEVQQMAIFVARNCVILPRKIGNRGQNTSSNGTYKCFIAGKMSTQDPTQPDPTQRFVNQHTTFASKVHMLKVMTIYGKKLLSREHYKKIKFKTRVQEIIPFKAQFDDDDSAVIVKFLIWFSSLLNMKHAPWYDEEGSNVDQLKMFLELMGCLDVPARNAKYMEDCIRYKFKRRKVSAFTKSIMEQVYNPDLDNFDDADLIECEDDGVGDGGGFGDSDDPFDFLRMSNPEAGVEGFRTGEDGSDQGPPPIVIPLQLRDDHFDLPEGEEELQAVARPGRKRGRPPYRRGQKKNAISQRSKVRKNKESVRYKKRRITPVPPTPHGPETRAVQEISPPPTVARHSALVPQLPPRKHLNFQTRPVYEASRRGTGGTGEREQEGEGELWI